jgi:CBS domain-containing protein
MAQKRTARKRATQSVRDVMTPSPVALPATATLVDAARAMSESNIGDVVVLDNGRVAESSPTATSSSGVWPRGGTRPPRNWLRSAAAR